MKTGGVCDWLTGGGESQVCRIVLIETVTLSVLEFPDGSATFAAVEQSASVFKILSSSPLIYTLEPIFRQIPP